MQNSLVYVIPPCAGFLKTIMESIVHLRSTRQVQVLRGTCIGLVTSHSESWRGVYWSQATDGETQAQRTKLPCRKGRT